MEFLENFLDFELCVCEVEYREKGLSCMCCCRGPNSGALEFWTFLLMIDCSFSM